MIIVTGGAGFIGANLVKGLNVHGYDDVLVVDDLTDGQKVINLADCRIADYIDKSDFLRMVESRRSMGSIDAVFHNGACSDTMETDGRYMMQSNYTYSRRILEYCTSLKIPLIYASSASVYGNGRDFSEHEECEHPLNVYAYSKWLFDQHVRLRGRQIKSQVVGLRYFNVYGPREQHKGRMASVAFHFYNQYKSVGKIRLFEGTAEYGNGEQRRDFVWVGDVVDVNLFFLEHPDKNGIFNVGTGNSQSFNDVATAVINAYDRTNCPLQELVETEAIEYISFPEALEGKYQSYTQADISALRGIGYDNAFSTVEEGVRQYVDWRKANG